MPLPPLLGYCTAAAYLAVTLVDALLIAYRIRLHAAVGSGDSRWAGSIDIIFLLLVFCLCPVRATQAILGVKGRIEWYADVNVLCFSVFAFTKSLILVIWVHSLKTARTLTRNKLLLWSRPQTYRIFLGVWSGFVIFLVAMCVVLYGKTSAGDLSLSSWFYASVSWTGAFLFLLIGMSLYTTMRDVLEGAAVGQIQSSPLLSSPSPSGFLNSPKAPTPAVQRSSPFVMKHAPATSRVSVDATASKRIVLATFVYGVSYMIRGFVDSAFYFDAKTEAQFMLQHVYYIVCITGLVCEVSTTMLVLFFLFKSLRSATSTS